MSSGGPRLLLLHGFLSSSIVWGPVRRELNGAATVITPDLLGYGRSERPNGSYELSDLVRHLGPILEREQPTHVVGHSMGAIVALALAAEHPGRFARVGLVGLPVYHHRPDARLFLDQRGWFYRAVLSRDRVAHAGCASLRLTRGAWIPFARFALPRQPRDVLLSTFDHCATSHSSGLERVVFAGLVEDLARHVEVPVAVLHGERDRSAPIDRVQRLAGLAGWDFLVAPGAGHQVVVEEPAAVARWVHQQVLSPPSLTRT